MVDLKLVIEMKFYLLIIVIKLIKLEDYLNRHPEIEQKCSKNGQLHFLTTENKIDFDTKASLFLGKEIDSEHIRF